MIILLDFYLSIAEDQKDINAKAKSHIVIKVGVVIKWRIFYDLEAVTISSNFETTPTFRRYIAVFISYLDRFLFDFKKRTFSVVAGSYLMQKPQVHASWGAHLF